MPTHLKILNAILVGAMAGLAAPELEGQAATTVTWITDNVTWTIGELWLRALKMLAIPMIFAALVIGIAELDVRKLGRVGVKTLFYFEAVSTLALVIGLVVGKLLQPGKGFDIVISRWEGELDVGRLNKVMAHPVALGEEFEDQPA